MCQTCHWWTSAIFSFRKVLTKIEGTMLSVTLPQCQLKNTILASNGYGETHPLLRRKALFNAWSLNVMCGFCVLVLVAGLSNTPCSVHKGHQSRKPWSVSLESFRGEDDLLEASQFCGMAAMFSVKKRLPSWEADFKRPNYGQEAPWLHFFKSDPQSEH